MYLDLPIILLLILLAGAFFLLSLWLLGVNSKRKKVIQDQEGSLSRFKDIVDIEAEKERVIGALNAERTFIQAEIDRSRIEQQQAAQQAKHQRDLDEAKAYELQLSIEKLRLEMQALDEEANIQSFGFYQARYDFISSSQYLAALEDVRENQKAMITNKVAAACRIEWTVNGSRTEGRKQTNQTIKLILRAFNGECDAAIAKVKYNNVQVMETRIRKSWEAVNKLAEVQQCQIASDYLGLKLQELYLVHEYQEKVQEEKEEQRRIREQMRDEEIARRELERSINEAEKEETRQAEALRKAYELAEKAVGEKQQKLYWQIEELKRRLVEAQTKKDRAISLAQMTRSGHVYIISNIGSFGEEVYKIGMTRRLDPLDRVRELGDASVPFQFDVHAVIFSEDAPTLENSLHRAFHHRRVNLINERKEFFQVPIEEIAQVVYRQHGQIEITRVAEAAEYRKTLAKRQQIHQSQTVSQGGAAALNGANFHEVGPGSR